MICELKFSKNKKQIIDIIIPSLTFDGMIFEFKYYFINEKAGKINTEVYRGKENKFVLNFNSQHKHFYKNKTIKDIIE
jgi:hypothetical protein